MKIVFYDDFKLGLVEGDSVFDASEVAKGIEHTSPQDLLGKLIERFPAHKGRLEQIATEGGGVPISTVRLRSPVPKPHNIVAMAVNYMEDGTRAEPAPRRTFISNLARGGVHPKVAQQLARYSTITLTWTATRTR